jgi:CRISPR-associated protein Cas1
MEGTVAGGDPTGEVMAFSRGFTFTDDSDQMASPECAEESVGEGAGIREPGVSARRVLYLGVQGSRARVKAGRLLVEKGEGQKKEVLLDVPRETVSRIVCFGAVSLSAGVRSWALRGGIEAVFVSGRGTYQGAVVPADGGTRVARLRAQLQAADDPQRALAFGRLVTTAKISKQVTLLARLCRPETVDPIHEAITTMRGALEGIPHAGSRQEVMGWEGAAARAYFAALGELVPAEVRFSGRTRRPPRDVVNAALSYGYALLASEATTALRAAGLDPAIGLLHADHERRPSLALDIMEEFRPLVVDQVVITAATRGWLGPEHGEHLRPRAGDDTLQREDPDPDDVLDDDDGLDPDDVDTVGDGEPYPDGGVWLDAGGRRVVVGAYERRMLQVTRTALPGFAGSLRRHLYRQAQRVCAVVLAPAGQAEGVWTGLSWR